MKTPRIVLTLGFIVMLIVPGGAIAHHELAAKAQPELLQIAKENPGQSVTVIVQELGQTDQAEAQVARLGGHLTHTLSMINAFTADMTAQAAVELSQNETVRWISLDATVESSACSQCIDTTNLASTFINTIKADKVWNKSP